jgi:hydroxyethylthiazole kinase-like uncharacterized protein yjeF
MTEELLTVAQMAQADALTIASGTPGFVLMQAAGRAVAQAMMQRWSPRRVVVLCGPGNNGGDGWVVAQCLRQAAWPVTVASLVSPPELKGDAWLAAQAWLSASTGERSAEEAWMPLTSDALDGAELVVDAIFGAGLNRPIAGLALEVLTMAHMQALPIVAVDVPSGVFGDDGRSDGAVPSALTVTFFRLKPAHALMPSRALCGDVVLADIGVPDTALSGLGVQTWDNQPELWRCQLPQVDIAGHKYHRGHALVWGGPLMTGAARLSAMAAARMGAGLTTVCAPQSAWVVYAATLSCVMVHPVAGEGAAQWQSGLASLLNDARLSAILIGPGALGGTQASGLKGLVLTVLSSGRPVVLDADALNVFADDPALLFAAIAGHSRPVVLTPHEGEFSRIFRDPIVTSAPDKLSRARAASRLSGAVVLLKGADTVVAAPDGRATVNRHAPAWLATAGSGDVLAGMILGLLAQGMPTWQAACAGVWLHGEAAFVSGPGLIADDLPGLIPQALKRLN